MRTSLLRSSAILAQPPLKNASIRKDGLPPKNTDGPSSEYLLNAVREQPRTAIYIYLEKTEFVRNWVEGGSIPLTSARRYLAAENKGALTVDELSQTVYKDEFGRITDGSALDRHIGTPSHHPGLFISMVGCVGPEGMLPDVHLEKRVSEAVILCMSTCLSADLAGKLGKSFCIEITDFTALITAIEKSSGQSCRFGHVQYRQDRNRSHFVKGKDNSYMRDFRVVLLDRADDQIWVNLPPGIAKEVPLV